MDNKEIIEELIEGPYLADDIQIGEIPDIDLYMDQMLELLNRRLDATKREPLNKGLTKMMVNNYTKEQLLMPPVNRKYGKYHVLLLILICQLKNILSINDIKRLFNPVLNDINTPDDDIIPLEFIYTTFLDLKREQYEEFHTFFAKKREYIENKTAPLEEHHRGVAETFLTIMILIAQADVAKRLAEKIIDACFVKDRTGLVP